MVEPVRISHYPVFGTPHTGLNRTIFPCTIYTTGNVKEDSVGAKMWEQVRAKQLEAARRAAMVPSRTTGGASVREAAVTPSGTMGATAGATATD